MIKPIKRKKSKRNKKNQKCRLKKKKKILMRSISKIKRKMNNKNRIMNGTDSKPSSAFVFTDVDLSL